MPAKEKRYTFTHYLCGALPARLGDKMSAQAILLLGLGAAHTVSLGSILLAGLTISAAVGGPLLGALLDKTKQPGRVLAAAIALHALGVTCIALTLGHIPAWLSVTCAVAAGFFLPAISGGWSSRLKSFTNEERIPRASAIDALTFNITGLAGPALAGLIAAWAGAGWAVAILVTLLVAALPMAWRLPKRPHTEHSNKSFTHNGNASASGGR